MAETRSGKGGTIFAGVLVMLFGAFLLFTSYSIANETGKCAGETLQTGDRCEHVGRATLHTNTVDEEKSEKTSSAWRNGAIGVVFLLIGGGVVYLGLRRPAVAAPGAAPSSPRVPQASVSTASHTDPTEAIGAVTRGEVVTFGDLALDVNGLRTPKGDLSWTEVEQAKLDGQQIVISKRGKIVPIVLSPKKVPHGRLVVALIEHLRTSPAVTPAAGPGATEALDALARGQVLTYGTLTLDNNGLRTPHGDLAWRQIRKVELNRNDVAIYLHGKIVPMLVPQAEVPQYTLVTGLSEHLINRLV
ncbi:hypothetical protein ACFYUD_13955 [Nocardia tengchongensis]|uniref:hypothetical protein n=1 Tax=Nocardia tengchongensis TaxID=2055889 RepID=UPI0036B24E88